MPDSLDHPLAARRAKCKADEVATEDEARHGWPEVLDRHTQGDEGAKEAVGELDQARRHDQCPDLRPHQPVSLLHRASNDNRLSSSILPGSAHRRRNGAAEISPWEGQL